VHTVRRFLSELLIPSRRGRGVPLGRLAIGSLLVFVVLFVIFTLSSMGVQLPFVSHPYVLNAWFTDAAGLDASNGPQVSVAGVPEGQVKGVRYAAGRAFVTMSMSSDARGKVFRDASVRVRPFNGANFLQVDISPGHPSAGSLPAGATIDAARTSIPVATDQVFGVLDADTRAYLQILTAEAAVSLHGGGGALADALHRLAPLSGEARQIGAMLAQRTRLIAQLVGQSNAIFGTLGARRAELAQVVTTASQILSVTGARSPEIAQTTRQLPAVLAQGEATSAAISSVAPNVELALTRLAPAARAFGTGLRTTLRATPALNQFLEAMRSLSRDTLTPSGQLLALSAHLGDGVDAAIVGYENLTQIVRTLIAHEKPIRQFIDAISGEFSTQDAYGVLGRVKFLGIQTPTAEDLGLAPAAVSQASGTGGHSELELMLGKVLDQSCRRSGNPVTCLLAVATPGVPGSLVSRANGLIGQRSGGAR
jgi:phospholipid/cholesterol/gamma-HCH transport system substrate-binding protein